ncbi:MAG: hypothetical protein ABIO70_34505 [Pseudomonadota bacterium]
MHLGAEFLRALPLPLLALSACAHAPPVTPLEGRQEVVCQFAIAAHGQRFAGLMAAALTPEGVQVSALTPAGTELFRVSDLGGDTEVSAPDPTWEPWLARLPFRRDLSLVFAWSCPAGRCAAGGGVLTERALPEGGVERSWRGPDGPVVAEIVPGRAVLTDERRGTTVTLAGEAVRVP